MYILDSKALAKSVDAYCSFFGITKKEFHAQSGISSGTLSQWRNGTYEPAKESVEKLIKYTGLSIGDLLSCNFSSVVPEENRKYVTDEKTATNNGDGQISPEAIRLSNDREELKRLVDRLTQEEVSYYLSDFRKTILGQ